mmetsp:Transcript_30191/g.101785  ORF Transcript_30191/g.101785 Transcript_30191/m.101785 type:complete len:413 (-) Transcript_30191:1726-2964(-)
MDAVVRRRRLQRQVPLAGGLVQRVQKVEAAALSIKASRVVAQAQLDGHGGDAGLELGRAGLGGAHGGGASGVAHVPEADLCHVEALRLDANVRHVLPDARRLDQPHGAVRLVHVAHGEVEGKRQQRRLCLIVDVAEAHKVAHHARRQAHVAVGGLGAEVARRSAERLVDLRVDAAVVARGRAAAREEQPRDLDAEQRLKGRLEGENVLEQHAKVGGDEERRHLDFWPGVVKDRRPRGRAPHHRAPRLAGAIGRVAQAQRRVRLLLEPRGGGACVGLVAVAGRGPRGTRLAGEQLGLARVPEVRHGDAAAVAKVVGVDDVALAVVDVEARVGLADAHGRAVHAVREDRDARAVGVAADAADRVARLLFRRRGGGARAKGGRGVRRGGGVGPEVELARRPELLGLAPIDLEDLD